MIDLTEIISKEFNEFLKKEFGEKISIGKPEEFTKKFNNEKLKSTTSYSIIVDGNILTHLNLIYDNYGKEIVSKTMWVPNSDGKKVMLISYVGGKKHIRYDKYKEIPFP